MCARTRTHTHTHTGKHSPGDSDDRLVWEVLINTIPPLKLDSHFSISASVSTSALISLIPRNALLPEKAHLACPALTYMGLNSISLEFPSVDPRAVPGLGRFLFHMTARQIFEAASTSPQGKYPWAFQLCFTWCCVGSPPPPTCCKNTRNLISFGD